MEIEAVQLLNMLESNRPTDVSEAKSRLGELFSSVKEPWPVAGFVNYYLTTGSRRAVDVLSKAPPPHDRFLCDRLAEALRGGAAARASALGLLGHVVRRQPSWLHKTVGWPLFGELLDALRDERDVVALVSGLLALIALLPAVPTLLGPHLPDVFGVFARVAAWECRAAESTAHGDHLRLALYGLFECLYGMYPCNFVDFLRREYAARRDNAEVFAHTVRPMLETVRLHPMLVADTRACETEGARFKKAEHHDVLVECRRFSSEGARWRSDEARFRSRSGTDASTTSAPTRRRGPTAAALVEPGLEGWFSPHEACGAPPTSAADDPPPPQSIRFERRFERRDGGSPPEAAVEATPENTPVKDDHRRRFEGGGGVARAKFHHFSSQPTSPLRKEPSPFFDRQRSIDDNKEPPATGRPRLERVLVERSFSATGGAPPPPSPTKRSSSPRREEEDDELEAEENDPDERWANDEVCGGDDSRCADRKHGLHMPRSKTLLYYCRRAVRSRYFSHCVAADAVVDGSAAPFESKNDDSIDSDSKIKKSASCPNIKLEIDAKEPRRRRSGNRQESNLVKSSKTAETQTIDSLPSEYEHLFADILQNSHCRSAKSENLFVADDDDDKFSPYYHIDKYEEILSRHDRKDPKDESALLKQRLELAHLELAYERHRREVHAVRNRRLLGRSRKNRASEEMIGSLNRQLSALQLEKTDLCQQVHKQKQSMQLMELNYQENNKYWQNQIGAREAEIQRERQERERLAALLLQQQNVSNESSADVQHLRANLFDVTQQLQRALRKSEMGDRQLECIRRLQRELIICGERDIKYKEILNYLPSKSDTLVIKQAQLYKDQLAQSQSLSQSQSVKIEQLQVREAELEGASKAKDANIKDLKKQLQLVKEENSEKLKSVEEKYLAIKRTNQRLEVYCLELLQRVPQSPQTNSRDLTSGFSPQSSPLSASLASSEGHGPLEIRNLQAYVNTPHETIEESTSNNVNHTAFDDDPH